jgi:single-strand DNA-binding protein
MNQEYGPFGMAVAVITGRLTDAPKKKQSGETSFAAFSIAVNLQVKKGEIEAQFYDCIAFEPQAGAILKHLEKGSAVWVSGPQRLKKYKGKDGQDRMSVGLVVNSWGFATSSASDPKEKKPNGEPKEPVLAKASVEEAKELPDYGL